MNPKVSFIVPCYKLAHLLGECLASILSQTFTDFEVLVMDDCSPDNTAEVATSFNDPRIRYIRNDPNLGHLRNYNKGIELSRGEYVWLISADDKLRKDYALERYVRLMDKNPSIGYVFSSGVGLESDQETSLLKDFWWGDRDQIFRGRKFLNRVLTRKGGILAPSTMVRKVCYEKVSMFPTDMPHQGDLYLWCVWALQYDVAYFSEPLVAYRLHELNIMKTLQRKDPDIIISDQLAVQWRVKRKADHVGQSWAARAWLSSVADVYTFCLLSEHFGTSPYRMTFEDFETRLFRDALGVRETKRVLATVYAGFGDGCYRYGKTNEALHFYLRGLKEDCLMPKVWIKVLLRGGLIGNFIRKRRLAF